MHKNIITSAETIMNRALRVLRIRSRYFLTRHNRLLLRYVASSACLTLACFIFALTISKDTEAITLSEIPSPIEAAQDTKPKTFPLAETQNRLSEVLNSKPSGTLVLASLATQDIPRPRHEKVKIKSGDALSVVLQRQGVGASDTRKVIKALEDHYDPRRIRVGQEIAMFFDLDEDGEHRFDRMKIAFDPIKAVLVEREGDQFRSSLQEKEVKRVARASAAEIDLSVFGAAARASIPRTVVGNMIKAYSWNVDFQRDIRKGDRFEILYDSFETEEGYVAKTGDIRFARLTLGGVEKSIYRYETKDGRVDFFDASGMSIRKTLMKTPVDGARMSSGYGMRMHPILGYNKMHKGVDFAAPTGTPIYAAGDGVVERASRYGAYGNYIRIRHNSKLKTAYAHLHRMKVKAGTRVKQGQIIGTIGSTGRSTGPHLHYEVIKNGVQVNPRSIDLPIGEQLKGTELAEFKSYVRKVNNEYKRALTDLEFADGKAQGLKSFFN